ncbi:YetF domain-containing protein [uncultured Kriegella sp.]|uniref:DUF421 domain-containing protein n=1 Tax=uncultured Kriegella sp. TaxID=1798910 RepID=UPI0030D7039A|tara:strand:+ start:18609 stop:19130 length:522 start_codon:yes stop_codon:yes gene_type:complete
MEKLFETSWTTVMVISLTALGIYLAVILFTRICGKRSFSKMSSFDFAMTVAIGSIIATTVLSSSVKLIDGVVGLAAVYILQISTALARRNKFIQKVVDNSPLLLMDGEKILEHNLRKARVSQGDLRSKLREANVTQLSQIKAVVFEATGDISVLHEDSDQPLNLWLMKDVMRE